MTTKTQRMPAYRRVWSDLRMQILRNEYPVDTALPTEAAIALKYAVSRQTVRRAFHDLVAEELVFRVPGLGTFATQTSGPYLRHFGTIDDLMALSDDSSLQILQPLTSVVDPVAARRLSLTGDYVSKVEFLRIHQDEEFSHTTVYLPANIGAELVDVEELKSVGVISPITVIGILDRVLPSPIHTAEQVITVAPASEEVADSLHLPLDAPVLQIDRLYFDDNHLPVELAISHFNPNRYSYRVTLRRNQI